MSRRYDDYYEDRREREYVTRGHGRYDDRYYDEEIEFRRSRPAPVREREREEVRVEEVIRGPAYVREEFDRVPGGQVVLRSREREEYEYAPPPPRRRSPSPDRRGERETITIRRDRSQSRPASRPPMPPPPPPEEKVREEIIIKRTDNDERRSQVEFDDTRSRKSYAPPRGSGDIEKEEIIIRREETDRSAAPSRVSARPKSRERERSRHRSASESEDEIIIRRNEREGRKGERQSEEIIIRRRSRSSSSSRSRPASVAPSAAPSVRTAPPPEPRIINAPQIHQEVITHHRHIDHGYEIALPPKRVVSRPPSPPSPPRSLTPSPPPPPPPARERSEERIEIHRSGEKNGRSYHDDIVIDRNEGASSAPPSEVHSPEPRRGPPPPRDWRDERDIEEEAAYYNRIALRRGHPGEAYHGATRDWELVDIPPGTKRVHMDGAGGGAQEISWQRYNGMRRSKFYPDDDDDDAYSRYEMERSRPLPPPAPLPAPVREQRGDIGGRFGRARNPKDGLWTEITKDLVVKEAITEMGYEYEETDEFYYIIAYLKYDDVTRLVGLSEDIRKDRRKRVKELEWESRVKAEDSPRSSRLAIEPPPAARDRGSFDRDEDRYIEREIVYRGGRPPPPVGWRR